MTIEEVRKLKEQLMGEYILRRNQGEEFEYYVERFFVLLYKQITSTNLELKKINERLTKMATLAEQLGVEETTLAEVVPKLATAITTLQSTLATKETELKADVATIGADAEQIKKFEAELAAIQKVQESLAPVVEEAQKLVPQPTGTETPTTPPAEQPATPPAETPVTPPAETPPVETPTEAPPAEHPPVENPETPEQPVNPEG